MNNKPRANDFTGRQRTALMKEHATEVAARKDEISMQSAVEAERVANEVIDVSVDTPMILDEVQDLGVGMSDNTVVMRVNEDIDQMTLAKQAYDFKVGVKYRVPKDLYDYLDDLGYVWH